MRALIEWIDQQDVAGRKSGRSFGTWVSLAVLSGGIVSLGSVVPGTRALFRLEPWPPLLLLGLLLLVAMPLALYERRRTLPQRVIASIELLFALGMELFASILVAFSELPGAAVFAGIAVFTTTWYGWVFRVSPKTPWHAMGSVLVFTVAVALRPTSDHVAIFAVVGLTGVAGKLLLGAFAQKADRHRAESEQLRAAVQAQMLDDQSHKITALADMLLDIVARNHDVRNAVMAAHVGAETLQLLTRRDHLDAARGTVAEIAQNLEGSLDRVTLLLEEISSVGRERLAEVAPDHVRVKPVLTRLVAEVQRRFPSVRLELAAPSGATMARVAGGEVTLARIVENALVNACEGNGDRHAGVVWVSVEAGQESPYLRLIVKDDGPGFAASLLGQPVQGFFTTKQGGTGLGLYTLERLTRASGGRVARANDEGALLTIELVRSEGERLEDIANAGADLPLPSVIGA